jgi:hypothetical protein
MKSVGTVFRALLLAFLLQSPLSVAAVPTSDQSDLWWNAGESGWGLQMVERNNIIFATMYVYDANGNPVWYTSLMNPQGNLTWTGDLYASNGSWFGAVPYVPSAFRTQKVGTMTWTAADLVSGTLAYSVNGTQVSKSIVRFYLATEDFSGTYLGAIHSVLTGCTNPMSSGTSEPFQNYSVVQNGSALQLTTSGQGQPTCTFAGALTQTGRFGSVTGQFTCDSGANGSFSIDGMAVGINTLSLHITGTDMVSGCTATGYLGGIRHR